MADDASTTDTDSMEDSGSDPSEEPEYTFPGFNIEFSRKIMLIPAGAGPGAGEPVKGAE